jgi:hypothetical protein
MIQQMWPGSGFEAMMKGEGDVVSGMKKDSIGNGDSDAFIHAG